MDHKYEWNIVGHDRVIGNLEKDLKTGNISHAYLFAGPDNVGKASVARKMASILQCENNFCHSCSVCLEIEKKCHADTVEISDDGSSIRIEMIREILAKLHMSRRGKYKILIIKNIERMTAESANAMLKTLEDPPDNVIFLMTTSRLKEILPTIISRVRVYHFHRLAEKKVIEIIQKYYPLAEGDLSLEIAAFAVGKPGKALQFIERPEQMDEARKMYNDIRLFIRSSDRATIFSYIAELVKASKEEDNNDRVKNFVDAFLYLLREHLHENLENEEKTKQLVLLLKDVQKSHELIKRNVNSKLLLENLTLKL